ncbi:MAG: hypothetical protein LUO98_05770 [Methanoregula sp.]|nr:hypothetical protein [Methanoregula sp.]
MIIPEHCKQVGHASTKPCDDKVYFLSRWLLRDTPGGHEVLEVTLDQNEKGMMRTLLSSRVLAQEKEVYRYPEKVNLHNRTRLVELALDTGYRCTIFTGYDEHQTFVLDPDLSGFLTVHVYDVTPPRPSLSSCIRELETAGLFGDLSVQFSHHVRDIREVHADVYPCRAAGFERTLDADTMQGGEQVAGCLTSSQFYTGCYGKDFRLVNICPLECVSDEPFIARCCRAEREGTRTWNGKSGAVVHWGAQPAKIYDAVRDLATRWRTK